MFARTQLKVIKHGIWNVPMTFKDVRVGVQGRHNCHLYRYIELAVQYKYLGVVINQNGTLYEEMGERPAAAAERLYKMKIFKNMPNLVVT